MPHARRAARAHLFRLPKGSDILEALTDYCRRRRIRLAAVQLIGATSKVCFGYYDQRRRVYVKRTFRQEMEILSGAGNVSLKDGRPFLHLHVVMGDVRLKAWGGHLFPGSEVFAAEALITELDGPALERSPDPETGLALWPCQGF